MKFKEYLQCDERWKNEDYSAEGERTNICESGCGTTCMAMVLATWVDPSITPVLTTRWSKKNGFKALRQGTYYSYFKAQASVYGLKAYQLNGRNLRNFPESKAHERILLELKKGNAVIACMGPGIWTTGGHYVLLTDVDEWKDIAYVNDPASTHERRTRGRWSEFKKQVKYYFIVNKPEGVEKMEEKNRPHDWAEKDWNRATEMKLYNGTRPRDPLTREESAIVACRVIDYVLSAVERMINEKLGGGR